MRTCQKLTVPSPTQAGLRALDKLYGQARDPAAAAEGAQQAGSRAMTVTGAASYTVDRARAKPELFRRGRT
jgi:hypothetical protein